MAPHPHVGDEVAEALASCRIEARAPGARILSFMVGGIACGASLGIAATAASLLTLSASPATAMLLLLALVAGALAGAAIDTRVRMSAEPRRWAVAAWIVAAGCWLLTALLQACHLPTALACAPVVPAAAALIVAVSMHTRCGLDTVRHDQRPLLRLAQWVGAMLGVVLAYSIGSTLALAGRAPILPLWVGIAAMSLLACAAASAQTPSARVLLGRGDVAAGVRAIVQSGRCPRSRVATEVTRILIGASLLDIVPRVHRHEATRRSVRIGCVLALAVGTGGLGAWALVMPVLLLHTRAPLVLALSLTLAGFALSTICLVVYSMPHSPLAAVIDADPEGIVVRVGAANAAVVGAASLAAGLGIGPLPVGIGLIVSIVLGSAILVPAGITAVRSRVPRFSLRIVRYVLYGSHMAGIVVVAVAACLGWPALATAVPALAHAGAVLAAWGGLRGAPAPRVTLPRGQAGRKGGQWR